MKDSEIYGNPNKVYRVMFLKTNKSAGHYKNLQDAQKKQKAIEDSGNYATIIRVDPKTFEPLYGKDGYPMPL
jgi:hypothetical protein